MYKLNKLIGVILVVVGAVLLTKMHQSQIIATGIYYDPEYSAWMHPFNVGLQISVLYGIIGAVLLSLGGMLIGLKGIYCNAISLVLFDLCMYPTLMKESKTYAMLVWEMDYTLIGKIYNISSLLLIIGMMSVLVYGVVLTKRKQSDGGKYRNLPAIALFTYTYVDILMKAFMNPWYIYCSLAVVAVNIFIIKLFQSLKTEKENLV